jgi:hypothetical protein
VAAVAADYREAGGSGVAMVGAYGTLDLNGGGITPPTTSTQYLSKGARCVKPWLSGLDVPQRQELAGDRLGWRKMLKSTDIIHGPGVCCRHRAEDWRWIERKVPRGV